MTDDRESPSGGWREVYREMDADAGIEDATYPCPDCGRTCENVLRDVYECDEHGVFSASADDGGGTVSDEGGEASNGEREGGEIPDGEGDPENRARGTAD